MRIGNYSRKTKETDITVTVRFDDKGDAACEIPIPFFSHMLDSFCRHGGISLAIKGCGDTDVTMHHFLEDSGFVIGRAVADALGDFCAIERAGTCIMPMDEALVMAVIDISGRSWCECRLSVENKQIGSVSGDDISEFFAGFSRGLGCAVHMRTLNVANPHHTVEAAFKAFGRALAQACKNKEGAQLTTTKGVIDHDNDR